jgi:Xaa-Pro aminopeptidase
MSIRSEEKTGQQFNLDIYLASQEKTRKLVSLFSKLIVPGMTEVEAKALLEKLMDESGLEKRWHPSKMRIGKNTVKSFRDESEPIILSESDLFFVDIGPVFSNHEADYGETFVIGNNPQFIHLRDSTRKVFDLTKNEFHNNKLSGKDLYAFAENEASKLNLRLNTAMYGHRLGDFPHAVYSRDKLGLIEFSPTPNLWILEIHLIDDSIGRGAFFEDLL